MAFNTGGGLVNLKKEECRNYRVRKTIGSLIPNLGLYKKALRIPLLSRMVKVAKVLDPRHQALGVTMLST